MTPYTTYRNIQGIIYQDDMDKNHLMGTDELHKFSDGTLNHVRTSLNDIATGIQMEYLLKRKWTKQDKQRDRVMIKAIDKKLKYRRLMQSLEKSNLSDNSKENSDKSLVKEQVSQVKSSFVEGCGSNISKSVSEVEPNKVRKNNDAPIIEDWVSDDEEQDESKT
ncbi:hypothetical protein Tco_1551902, partial [Tanacetum coccineum]